jgi:hypothetical protein
MSCRIRQTAQRLIPVSPLQLKADVTPWGGVGWDDGEAGPISGIKALSPSPVADVASCVIQKIEQFVDHIVEREPGYEPVGPLYP